MAQRQEQDLDFSNSKIPPGWDGISKSLQQYLEELEDWMGYTELMDKPARIGPAMKSRLRGKPKLISKMLTAEQLCQIPIEAQLPTIGPPATVAIVEQAAGWYLLKSLLIEKLKDDDADYKWVEVKRFQTLSKQHYESFREFIPMFEIAYERAKSSGFELSGDGKTFQLFDACHLTETQRLNVLTHTSGSHEFDLVINAMRRILDPASTAIARKETDDIRRRGNAALATNNRATSHFQGSRSHNMYFTHDDQEHEPYTPGVSSGTQHMFPIQESRSPPPRSVTSTSSESCFSVSENDRDEFIQLYTQHKQVTKSLKKFRGEKPYRPTQSKKCWITSTNSSTQNKPMFKKVFLLEDDGELVELNPEDQVLHFASFAKKTTSSSTTHNPNKFKVPGGNPIDRKTGKRMLCNTCQSPDHFERDCKSAAPKSGFFVSHDDGYEVVASTTDDIELDICL